MSEEPEELPEEEPQPDPVVEAVKEAISEIEVTEEEPIETHAENLSSGAVKVGEELLSLQPKETEEV